MARLLLLGPAHEAAGVRRDDVPGSSVEAVLATAVTRYGDAFAAVLAVSQIWLNGAPLEGHVAVGDDDEVAVLPPVSGG